jgi:hypothetical protein
MLRFHVSNKRNRRRLFHLVSSLALDWAAPYSDPDVATIQSSVIDQGDSIIVWKNREASPIAEGCSVGLW